MRPFIGEFIIHPCPNTEVPISLRSSPMLALAWMVSSIEGDLKEGEKIESVCITEPFKVDVELCVRADIENIVVLGRRGKQYKVSVVTRTYKGCDLYIERRAGMLLRREAFRFKK